MSDKELLHPYRMKLYDLCATTEECFRLVLGFYVCPKSTSNPNEALANLFKKEKNLAYLYSFRTSPLLFSKNTEKVFYKNDRGENVVKNEIKIEELDISFLSFIIKNIHTLMSTNGQLLPCKNAHLNKCCMNHDHKCSICHAGKCSKKPMQCCADDSSICNHDCLNCKTSFSNCKTQGVICCEECKLCINCNAISSTECDHYIIQQHVDVLKNELRNTAMHLTNAECETSTFPEVLGCKKWNDVFEKFVHSLHYIILYLYLNDVKYVGKGRKDELFNTITNIKDGNYIDKPIEDNTNRLIERERLFDTWMVSVTENSAEIQINSLKINESFDRIKGVEEQLNKFKNIDTDAKECATKEVLNIISEEIDKDWKRLSEKLGVDVPFWKSWVYKSGEEHMRKCFEFLEYKVKWKDIRNYLLDLDRSDIVVKIENQKCKTLGDLELEHRSQTLKNYYKKELQYTNQKKFMKDDSDKTNGTSDRQEVYVQLKMGEWIDLHESEQENFLRSMHQQKEEIKMDELIDKDDRFIIIRGIAGIGKTWFVDEFVLEWANEKMYKEYDFVIKLTCRELNVLNNVVTLQELLNYQYPDKLGDFLYNTSAKVLFLLDGLDEFRYLQEIIWLSQGIPTDKNLAAIAYDFINPTSKFNKTVIVCGRPHASEEINRCFSKNTRCKLVEITGFKDLEFIDHYFRNNEELSKNMKQQLAGKEYLMAMVRIPIYASILCNVFNNTELIDELNTTTKLNIAACLCFLRDHMRSVSHGPLMEICRDKSIINTIKEVSKLAYRSIVEKKIIFNADDFPNADLLRTIVNSGIFEKHQCGENGCEYQFNHLVLQEFLCAIHIFAEGLDVEGLLGKPHLSNSLLIFVGLVGLLQVESEASPYLKEFVASLIAKNLYETRTLSASDLIEMVPSKYESKKEKLELISCVYEYHCALPDNLQSYFSDKELQFTILYHHNLQQLVYFLQEVKVNKVTNITINMTDYNMSPNEMEQIAPYLIVTETVELRNIGLAAVKPLVDCLDRQDLDESVHENTLKHLTLIKCILSKEMLVKLSNLVTVLECYSIDITIKNNND